MNIRQPWRVARMESGKDGEREDGKAEETEGEAESGKDGEPDMPKNI